jgi:hypothetical protein
MPDVSTLTLREAHRAGGGGRTARTYLDFYVSDRRLLDLLGCPNADYITPLGWGRVESQADAVAELLRKREPSLATGRRQLYVCPECGDIGCGAVTARLEREGDLIIWRDFGFENDYEDPRLTEFASIAPLYFDARSYWQTLNSFTPNATQPA